MLPQLDAQLLSDQPHIARILAATSMVGKRLSVFDRLSPWRASFNRSALSSRTWIEKSGYNLIAGACSRSSRAPIAWKVPDQIRASPAMRSRRRETGHSRWLFLYY